MELGTWDCCFLKKRGWKPAWWSLTGSRNGGDQLGQRRYSLLGGGVVPGVSGALESGRSLKERLSRSPEEQLATSQTTHPPLWSSEHRLLVWLIASDLTPWQCLH